MFGTIASYLTGRAAKAGMALITGALTTAGGAVAVSGGQLPDSFALPAGEYSIVGYVIIGAIGGLLNWATVYWKRNSGGLY